MSIEQAVWSGSYLAQMENEGLIATATEDEDWDMEAEERDYKARHQDIEAIEDDVAQQGVKYMALDTNALIDHLSRIQALYMVLQAYVGHHVSLLIPTAVVNELDGLKSRAKTESQARSATAWLLYINRAKRETGRGPVRSQKWSERLDQTLSKGDDRILDCCLFFKDRGADVVLWTADQGLSLLAEGNGTPTLSPPRSVGPVPIVMMAFGVDLQGYRLSIDQSDGEQEEMKGVRHLSSVPRHSGTGLNGNGHKQIANGGMDLDLNPTYGQGLLTAQAHIGTTSVSAPLEYYMRSQSPPTMNHRPATAPPSPPSAAPRPRTAPSTPARTHPQHGGPPLPTAKILSSLDSLARYIYNRLPPHADNPLMLPPDPTDRPTTNTARTLRTLSQTLEALHASTTNLTDDDKRNVWFAIGAINTICHFVRPSGGRAPCQEYQLRQALKDITTAFNDLGIPLNAARMESIMDGIRS